MWRGNTLREKMLLKLQEKGGEGTITCHLKVRLHQFHVVIVRLPLQSHFDDKKVFMVTNEMSNYIK